MYLTYNRGNIALSTIEKRVNVGAPRTASGTRRPPESNQPIDHSPFPTAKSDTGRPVFFRRSGSLTGDVARDTRRHTSGVVNTLFIFPAKNTLFNPTIILSSVLIINYFFVGQGPPRSSCFRLFGSTESKQEEKRARNRARVVQENVTASSRSRRDSDP
jgi:hypothetical protein